MERAFVLVLRNTATAGAFDPARIALGRKGWQRPRAALPGIVALAGDSPLVGFGVARPMTESVVHGRIRLGNTHLDAITQAITIAIDDSPIGEMERFLVFVNLS